MAASQSPSSSTPSTVVTSCSPGGKKVNEITDEEKKIEEKLLGGKYENLRDMATDINGGQPSKAVKQIIFRNMMKIVLNEFNK